MMKRVDYEHCPLCLQKNFVPLYSIPANRIIDTESNIPEIIKWVQCPSCDHVFTSGYYPDDCLGAVLNYSHVGQIVGDNIEQNRLTWDSIVFNTVNLFNAIEKARWLDIGFGDGGLLFTAKEYGFYCVGLDVRKKNVDDLNDMLVEGHCSKLEDYSSRQLFDVISLMDVLEHMPYPLNFIEHLKRNLQNDGVVIMSCPNSESMSWNIMNKNCSNPYWQEIEHFHNFSKTNLIKIFSQLGFKPVLFNISNRYLSTINIWFKRGEQIQSK